MPAIFRHRNEPDSRAKILPADQSRNFPIDSENAEIVADHYSSPNVNFLQEKAYRATEFINDKILEAAAKPLPIAVGIRLIIAMSLCCWGAIAAGIWLFY